MDRFDKPDILILVNDRDAAMELWGMANASKDAGDTSYEMRERMQKSFTPERIHEILIVVNDALKAGALITAIYTALRTVKGLSSKTLIIRISARLKLSRDERNRLESLGCEVQFEKASAQVSLQEDDDDQSPETTR